MVVLHKGNTSASVFVMLKLGQFRLDDLDRNYVAVVQLSTQTPHVIHQVTLRTDKIHRSFPDRAFPYPIIRLGETQGDEIAGWQFPETIKVVAILGHAVRRPVESGKPEQWDCVPIPDYSTEVA